MDNITHSLVGIALGEAACGLSTETDEAQRKSFRKACLWLAVIGSNLSDLDLISRWILPEGKLAYLLHHRGHTHTLVGALLQGMLLLVSYLAITRKSFSSLGKRPFILLGSICFLTPLLHLGMDFFNSYGVHPFWPWNNHWFYGDTLFIIEPWIWASLSCVLFGWASTKWSKGAYLLVALANLALVFFLGRVPLMMGLAITGYSFLLIFLPFLLSPTQRLSLLATVCIGIIGIFSAISFQIRSTISQVFEKHSPTVQLHDVILSPFPANPMCWNLITVETYETRVEYRLRKAVVSPFPSWMNAEDCVRYSGTDYVNSRSGSKEGVVLWVEERTAEISKFKELANRSCFFARFLQFSRAPLFEQTSDGLSASDFRFGSGKSGSFRFSWTRPFEDCGLSPAPWVEPRMDLLREK